MSTFDDHPHNPIEHGDASNHSPVIGSTALPAGWYADPLDSARVRFWDGARWSDHVYDPRRPPPPPEHVPKTTQRPSHSTLVAVAAIAAVGLVVAAVLWSESAHTPRAAHISATKKKASTTELAPPPTTESTSELVGQWATHNLSLMTDIGTALDTVTADSRSLDVVAVMADCRSLSARISVASAADPIPEATAEGHWSRALELLGQAANACTLGSQTLSPPLLHQAADLFQQASVEIGAATDAITRSR